MCQSFLAKISLANKQAPKPPYLMKQYYKIIPHFRYKLWSRNEDIRTVLDTFFEGPGTSYLSFPLEKDHADYDKSVDVTASRLVWAHLLFRNDRISEALTMTLSSWVPKDMSQRVHFLTLLIDLSAELHLKHELQCQVIHIACKYISSISDEFPKLVLMPCIIRAFLRWGNFSLLLHFYTANKDLCKFSVYEMKATMLVADGIIEEIENNLLFIVVYQLYHKNCKAQNTPCVSRMPCFKQVQHIETRLKTLRMLLDKVVFFYLKSDVNYYTAIMYFLQALFAKLQRLDQKSSIMRRLAHCYFYQSLEAGNYLFPRRSGECKVLGYFMADKNYTTSVDINNLRLKMGCDQHYYKVNLRVGQVLTKLLIQTIVLCKPSKARALCKEALKQYKAATNCRSYRIPLLKAAFNTIVIHRRHFLEQEESQNYSDECDLSFGEDDVNDESRRHCSLMVNSSLTHISLHQERNLIQLLAPNTENHQLKDTIKPCTSLKVDETNLEKINIDKFYLSDKDLIGHHVFYGLQCLSKCNGIQRLSL